MEITSTLDTWRRTTLPRVDASEWTVPTANAGLLEVARLRGLLDAAQSVLVGVMSKASGRDTPAALSRSLKMSGTEARKAAALAGVVGRVPGAEDALASGVVTAEHLLKLVPVTDEADAALLLGVAPGMSPEDFGTTVHKFRIAKDANGVKGRQRAARSVRFFHAEEGCVGMRAVLRPLDGERVKAALNAIVDERWRAEHPDRATTSGGHGGDSREQRLADALASVFGASPAESGAASDPASEDVGTQQESASGSAASTAGEGPAGEDSHGTSSTDEPETTGRTDQSDAGQGTDRAQRTGANSSSRLMPTLTPQSIPPSVATRLGVVVTINAETLETAILGGPPIAFADLGDILHDARTEFFAMIQATNGAILNFGRNRRLATPLQKLAVAVRDNGRCTWAGCQVAWDRCDVDHDPPFESGGRTDVDKLRLLCRCEHHPHRHETGENIERDASDEWIIIGPPSTTVVRQRRRSTAATASSGRRDRQGPSG